MRNLLFTLVRTASAMSASAKIMLGACPPSSRLTRLRVGAAWLGVQVPAHVGAASKGDLANPHVLRKTER